MMRKIRLSREEIAGIEVGTTAVSKAAARFLTIFFLSFVFLVPAVQYGLDGFRLPAGGALLQGLGERRDGAGDSGFVSAAKNLNALVLKKIDLLESSLEDDSFLRNIFLPPLQYVYLRYLGQGNEKVVVGRQGWLFYRPGVEALYGKPFLSREQLRLREQGSQLWEKPVQPDPVAAIVHFKKQLAARNIELLVVPVPVKPSFEISRLSKRSSGAGSDGRLRLPLENRSLKEFKRQLQEAGVLYFDVAEVLRDFGLQYPDIYLKTDTHWRPRAMEHVAKALGDFIETRKVITTKKLSLRLEQEQHRGTGDIAQMLRLPADSSFFAGQSVELNQVIGEGSEFWQPQNSAELLLLGDSFTNIFSQKGLGWGVGAGFAEHLSYNLQAPVDTLVRNDNGAYVTREMLATELLRGRDRLAGKKLVVWEFAERELALGDWKMIDLHLGTQNESEFYVVDPGERVKVTGKVAAISASPRPGSVPYRDNITTIHLVDLQSGEQNLDGEQALVYGFGMIDNELTRLGALRPDDRVELLLGSWDDVESKYGSYRRSPLDDEMMELELPNWVLSDDETI
ncbi:alginate O-acetyltransferase AlgX-related protein [Desulforhopalus singaporensis]|uniref:Alginate O-acetyltransferase complex protein AlgJ n=1 Tax=Desulforhopalus singaporensis TaxID=91360 RepID=A0A1H0T108_9BACT|nr:hypothetical protein [Desulforhopalus singaporensis]SDP47276.1 alginate O-acetyltransferase complex protein AlgJ [Desulforhopalus singaporensis]